MLRCQQLGGWRRDLAGYAFKVRQDVDIDMPDLAPSWKLPQPAPLRTRAPLMQLEAVSFAYPGESATDGAPPSLREVLRDITLCVEQVCLRRLYQIPLEPSKQMYMARSCLRPKAVCWA